MMKGHPYHYFRFVHLLLPEHHRGTVFCNLLAALTLSVAWRRMLFAMSWMLLALSFVESCVGEVEVTNK